VNPKKRLKKVPSLLNFMDIYVIRTGANEKGLINCVKG